jgi:hypothetical protein
MFKRLFLKIPTWQQLMGYIDRKRRGSYSDAALRRQFRLAVRGSRPQG